MAPRLGLYNVKPGESGRFRLPGQIADMFNGEAYIRLESFEPEESLITEKGSAWSKKKGRSFLSINRIEDIEEQFSAIQGESLFSTTDDLWDAREELGLIFYIKLDKEQRVILPPAARDHLGAPPGEELLIAALRDYAEIWRHEDFKAAKEERLKSV